MVIGNASELTLRVLCGKERRDIIIGEEDILEIHQTAVGKKRVKVPNQIEIQFFGDNLIFKMKKASSGSKVSNYYQEEWAIQFQIPICAMQNQDWEEPISKCCRQLKENFISLWRSYVETGDQTLDFWLKKIIQLAMDNQS